MAEHSPAATAATALMTPSTSRQEESTTATTTPKASNATSSPRAKMHVGMNLPGFLSMCIYRFLPTVLSKNPFQLKRKKSQELGSQGAMSKDGRPYIFLNEVCEAHDLPKSGSKQDVVDRLMRYFFEDPIRVPEYVSAHFPEGEWLKASNRDSTLVKDIDALCADFPMATAPVVEDAETAPAAIDDADDDEDSIVSVSSFPEPLRGTLSITQFPIPMLAAAYHAKRLRLYPESDTLFFCNHEFTTDLLDQALAAFDTSPWDTQPVGSESQVVQRRTATCALRLFVLLFVDDCFFERLLNESAAGPLTRDDLDVSAVGDNSNLWVDVCKAFTDDGYGIPPIPVSHRFFIDRN
jgi:hypothetical protein